ncbi:TRAP transporter substrate-binding protein [Draconibacterium halophilum]|uniref:TRAP transporter substrate-binding protein n=1 Tax=Draconibacterium halophilum TaxID=2706887 RepID=A0A6C0RHU0_9BACT|nr:TRAP transporter substrate-binding protein [Draconibacterium halophilum]QIA08661.1 TRAP transporter substrate-binding protein [Draconibacterium halophilum]
MRTKIFKTFSLVFVVVFLLGCAEVKEHKVLKLAHGLDPTHPVHKGMEFMAERLAEKSGGKLIIDIYPSGQLGSEQQCVELLQIGSLAITKVSAAVMESFTPKFKALGLPYVFRSKEHSFKVFDGEIGKELLLGTEEYWIRGLCFYDAGFRSFYTIDKPIMTPDDLKGLKIRVMKSQTAMEMVRALGGSPTPISWGELYTALQSGVVDGAENNEPSLYTSHHYEVCKHYSLDEHTCVPDVLIISTKVWNTLTEQEQKWLQEAADESVPVERKYWAESVEESLRIVQENGVTIHHPDKAKFAEQVSDLLDKYREDEVLGDILRRIEAVK